jgi:hypothetical protein
MHALVATIKYMKSYLYMEHALSVSVSCVLYYFFARSNQLRVSATEKVSVHKRAGPAAARMSMLYIYSKLHTTHATWCSGCRIHSMSGCVIC